MVAGLAVKCYARSEARSGNDLIERAVTLFKKTVEDSRDANIDAWLAAFMAKHPYVRYQDGDGDTAPIRHSVRPAIFAAVDVPLLALYKRTR